MILREIIRYNFYSPFFFCSQLFEGEILKYFCHIKLVVQSQPKLKDTLSDLQEYKLYIVLNLASSNLQDYKVLILIKFWE